MEHTSLREAAARMRTPTRTPRRGPAFSQPGSPAVYPIANGLLACSTAPSTPAFARSLGPPIRPMEDEGRIRVVSKMREIAGVPDHLKGLTLEEQEGGVQLTVEATCDVVAAPSSKQPGCVEEERPKKTFNLDAFYGPDDDPADVFDAEVEPILARVTAGRNATVFAYGPTGSGKTRLMQGDAETEGLIQLTGGWIFQRNLIHRLKMAYYELYCDKVVDLNSGKLLDILESADGTECIKGLTQLEISSYDEFLAAFSSAKARRQTGSTDLNKTSSRSHAILELSLWYPDGSVETGKLRLLDLAGSENNNETGNKSKRMQESCWINESLFFLSKVIEDLTLAQNKKASVAAMPGTARKEKQKYHIPYRSSKLTRVLKDSLGGGSHAVMIACLKPGNVQDTQRVLALAAKSRLIQKPRDNDAEDLSVDEAAKRQNRMQLLDQWRAKRATPMPSAKRAILGSNNLDTPHPRVALGGGGRLERCSSLQGSSTKLTLFQPSPIATSGRPSLDRSQPSQLTSRGKLAFGSRSATTSPQKSAGRAAASRARRWRNIGTEKAPCWRQITPGSTPEARRLHAASSTSALSRTLSSESGSLAGLPQAQQFASSDDAAPTVPLSAPASPVKAEPETSEPGWALPGSENGPGVEDILSWAINGMLAGEIEPAAQSMQDGVGQSPVKAEASASEVEEGHAATFGRSNGPPPASPVKEETVEQGRDVHSSTIVVQPGSAPGPSASGTPAQGNYCRRQPSRIQLSPVVESPLCQAAEETVEPTPSSASRSPAYFVTSPSPQLTSWNPTFQSEAHTAGLPGPFRAAAAESNSPSPILRMPPLANQNHGGLESEAFASGSTFASPAAEYDVRRTSFTVPLAPQPADMGLASPGFPASGDSLQQSTAFSASPSMAENPLFAGAAAARTGAFTFAPAVGSSYFATPGFSAPNSSRRANSGSRSPTVQPRPVSRGEARTPTQSSALVTRSNAITHTADLPASPVPSASNAVARFLPMSPSRRPLDDMSANVLNTTMERLQALTLAGPATPAATPKTVHGSIMKSLADKEIVDALNNATEEQLKTRFKGIGKVYATKISEARAAASPGKPAFQALDDLTQIGMTPYRIRQMQKSYWQTSLLQDE